jgi:hypothetical protein
MLGPLALAAGCDTFVTATPINPSPRPLTRRGFESVPVFTSGPPSRPHVDVALLEVEQTHDFNYQGTDLMIQRLREEAGTMACDAVVLGGMGERGSDAEIFAAGSTTMHATCIVYK